MGITSLQVCMDASEWLQGTMNATTNDDCGGGGGGMDSSSSPTLSAGDFHHQHNNNNNLFASRPAATAHMMDRRLRPPLDQILKCPRCDSTHTKFCYYNNYSLSQPRYFCKTCRRYWTKGGTLRNIPVGGGCRKNKKSSPSTSSSKKSSTTSNGNNNSIDGYNNTDISPGSLINQNNLIMGSSSSSSCGQHTELQLAFPGSGMQFSPLISSFIGGATGNHTNFLESKYNALLENIHYGGGGSGGGGNYNNSCRPIDFMDHQQQKFDALVMGRNLHDQADNHHHHHHRLMGNSLGSDNGVDFSILGGGGGEMGFTSDHHHQIQLQHHLTTTTTPSTPTTNFINSHQQYTNTLNMMMMMDNRLMLPYHHDDVVEEDTTTTTVSAAGVLLHDDVKPSLNKILTLECQDHQQHGTMMSTSTMPGGGGVTLGSSSWTNMMNGYGQSTPTNQII